MVIAGTRPRILIPVPTSFDAAYNAQSWPEYARAVEDAGGMAVGLDLTHSDAEARELAASASGILLPGSGADVDPARYGHHRDPASAPADPLREATDFALLEEAERSGIPMLTICFGTQSLNVYQGGTLIQDLSPAPVNHRAGRSVITAHPVSILATSRLAAIMADPAHPGDDPKGRLMVNSSHHQAIGAVGAGLQMVGHSPEDGVVEAVESTSPDTWLFGVQWHPERTVDQSAVSRQIFVAFVQAATRR